MTPQAMALLHAACFTVPRPWSAAEFAGLLADPLTLWVAGPQGFALGRVVAGEAELLTLAVDPAARRQGNGRRLLLDFLHAATARGATTALLEVAADNHAALALYQAAGFAACGRRRGYYRHPAGHRIDALLLKLALPPAAAAAGNLIER